MNTAFKWLGVSLSLAMLAAAPLGAGPIRASAQPAAVQIPLRVFAFGSNSKNLEVEPIQVTAQSVVTHLLAAQQTVRPGASDLVSGSGFLPNEKVEVAFGYGGTPVLATASATGDFGQAYVQVPLTITPGPHTITAVGLTSHRRAQAVVTILAQAVASPTISVNTPLITSGAHLTVSGKGFAGAEAVQIRFNNTLLATATTNTYGAFVENLNNVANGLPVGIYTLQVFGTISQRTVTTTITVVLPAAHLLAAQPTLRPGMSDIVSGSGFLPNEKVEVAFGYGGTPVLVTASATGIFSQVAVQAPLTITVGHHTITAIGQTSHREAQVVVIILAPQPVVTHLRAAQQMVRPGMSYLVSGSGFLPNEKVSVAFGYGGTPVVATASATGNFGQAYVQVPLTITPGPHTITAVGLTSHRRAQALVTILARAVASPTISVNASLITSGAHLTVSGKGFAGAEAVQVRFDNTLLASATTNTYGAFSVSLTVPSTLSAGSHTMVATGTTSHASASTTLQVQGQTPPPAAHVWYFPRGDSHPGYSTLYRLTNIQSFPVQANFIFMVGNTNPVHYSLSLPAHSRIMVDLSTVVGPDHDVFAELMTQHNIQVREIVTLDGHGYYSTYGVAGPRNSWYFSNGNSSKGRVESLILANPNGQTATLQIQFRAGHGQVITHSLSLSPDGFLNLDIASAFPDVPRGHHSIYVLTTNGVSFIAQDVVQHQTAG